MSALGARLIPLEGLNLDVAPQYLKSTQARYIKNLYYQLSDFGTAGGPAGANTGVLKPLPSTEIYVPFTLPAGDSSVIGVLPSPETNECYVFVYNSLSNHFIFRINGIAQTIDVGAPNTCFNFLLQPEYFIGEGQCYLEIDYVNDPSTGLKVAKKDIYWTDGNNYQGYLRFDDYLATNGYDPATFPYFIGNYDRCTMFRMGLPTPKDCLQVSEIPFDPDTDIGKNNNLKFNTWQFRVTYTDVFGRPSEHGIISDLFFLSNNQCLSASDMLSRCVNLIFNTFNPLIDSIQVEYRIGNSLQWELDTVLYLYIGNSSFGNWWLRPRNPDVNYNATTNQITYKFCKEKLCDLIDVNETNRTQNALPKKSQGLTKIGGNIALLDNTDGFPPFDKAKGLDKLSVTVNPPTANNIGKTANIEIYIRIINPNTNQYQKVWKNGTNYVFGGILNGTGVSNVASDYQQYFPATGQQGPIGYLAGTDDYAVGVQYYLDGNTFVQDTNFTQDYNLPYYLKFEFLSVPKSNYLFRLAGHLADPNAVDVRTTSTYVGGVFKYSAFNVGAKISDYKELVINVCENDYSTLTAGEMMLMYDLTYPTAADPFDHRKVSESSVGDGYIYEGINSTTGLKQFPVPLLQLQTFSSGANNINSVITDHNGFYFTSSINPGYLILLANGYCDCLKKELIKVSIGTNWKRYATDLVIGTPSIAPVTTSCLDFNTSLCSRVLIKGTLQLCGVGTGVPNVNIVLSHGGVGTSDSNGNFTIIAYDNVIKGSNVEQLYIMGGGCSFTDCDGGCIKVVNVTYSPCTGPCAERDVQAGILNLLFISNKGLLSGGRYGACLFGYDWLCRRGFAQTTDKLYFDIPTINQIKMFGFSQVIFNIPPDATFDSWVDHLTIGLTAELNYGGNYIDWIVDKVTFVDNRGLENDSAPTQIRIDYGSLNEYNLKNNFNTTTGWVITPVTTPGTATSPRTGDIVQFIRNGDGTWFPSPITALVKYDAAGLYFLIDYTDSLKDLKQNSLIRLANPTECANKDQFYELCTNIPVKNGKALVNSIVLNAYDTYYQYRQIPVPVTQTIITGTPPAPVTSIIIELRPFGFPFESPSVTDSWGYLCWNIGRFGFKNPYENEIISPDQIALSGSLSVNKQLNYLNYFDDANKYSPIINNSGGIVYAKIKTGIVAVVCQYVCYTIGFNDNIPRIDAAGNIIIPSAPNKFGNPFRDSVAQFGCQLFDKSTIREKNGLIQWIDRSKVAILQHDYSQVVDVARYNKADSTIVSWLTQKIKYQNQYNKNNPAKRRYFHAVINPLNFEWILSEFTIGGNSFVNEDRGQDVTVQETISFDTIYKVWKQFYSPTPEMFGYLENTNFGQILFAFKNGMAYSHTGSTYNVFFGIACESIFQPIFNTNGFDKKKFQSIWVFCVAKLYWADLVKTETQVSRILKSQWRKRDYFYTAPFLCDVNTNPDPNAPDQTGPNAILDGDILFGSYVEVRLIGDADGLYSELYGVQEGAAKDDQSG